MFDTLRIGFPTSSIRVYFRNYSLTQDQQTELKQRADGAKAELWPIRMQNHADWIDRLIVMEPKPFFILDTDVVFWRSIEAFEFKTALAGRRIPEFDDPFTGFITCERLHTALMWIDPVAVRRHWVRAKEDQYAMFKPLGIEPDSDIARQRLFQMSGRTYFHDSMGEYYNMCPETTSPFTEDHLECYDHLNCGTYADLVDEKIPGFRGRLESYIENPDKLKGRWRDECKWYAANTQTAV